MIFILFIYKNGLRKFLVILNFMLIVVFCNKIVCFIYKNNLSLNYVIDRNEQVWVVIQIKDKDKGSIVIKLYNIYR